ncbi:MAG: DUF983 domain-containing protein [Gemmatimonadetes bacterium]|nr:DUF983 domain-containing protein [Gemmatimonadota bacterium]MBK9691629.1 DUF983 domain-containing protein [Gemmatimonadota bacterium]
MTLLAGFGRALRLRCPACGGHPLFRGWLRMVERCPRCGLRTERGEQGYVVGAYMFNIMAAELIWAALFLAAVWATWPAPPWDALTWGGGALMLVMPFLCYPFSKTVFLAFDLAFRPPTDTGDAP